MFNYNVVNPVNIHYRKYPQNEGKIGNATEENKKQQPLDNENKGERKFPNGNKVAIDYTKNQVNIAQVLQDFRSTIAAINSPDEVKEEVELYLGLVSKETAKDEPSREIVLNNLKSAARVTDRYIQDSLKKPSKVVQDWVEALFLQKINLKPDENEVNEEFKVKIPEKKSAYTPQSNSAVQAYADNSVMQAPQPSNLEQAQAMGFAQNVGQSHKQGLAPLNQDVVEFNKTETVETEIVDVQPVVKKAEQNEEEIDEPIYTYKADSSWLESSYDIPVITSADYAAEQTIDTVEEKPVQPKETTYTPKTEREMKAKEALLLGKQNFANEGDLYNTLKYYDEALEYVEGSDNMDLKSAIYFERGKIFDSYDYAELALIDYHKATRCSDGNLRCHAHIKMGNIYDDYVQIDPAMDQYTKAIESAEEVNNAKGKNKALRCMATMFAGIYDNENTESFSDLAIEAAKEANSPKTLAKTYLEAANNYKYIGDETKALQMYSACAQDNSLRDDYETQADNFMQASMLMDKKGNKKKAYALLMKAKEYEQLAKLRKSRLAD